MLLFKLEVEHLNVFVSKHECINDKIHRVQHTKKHIFCVKVYRHILSVNKHTYMYKTQHF